MPVKVPIAMLLVLCKVSPWGRSLNQDLPQTQQSDCKKANCPRSHITSEALHNAHSLHDITCMQGADSVTSTQQIISIGMGSSSQQVRSTQDATTHLPLSCVSCFGSRIRKSKRPDVLRRNLGVCSPTREPCSMKIFSCGLCTISALSFQQHVGFCACCTYPRTSLWPCRIYELPIGCAERCAALPSVSRCFQPNCTWRSVAFTPPAESIFWT